ncbi:MAG: aminotransferase class I/II-fold pyridoxal phosphate-dependent enzyme [Acidimicrobiia bacterium]|nr:aminotransferase class I/II-fold pyridoxal phosphate-dependent enzyme [Acidimicrobiia bacterium]
MARQTTYRFDQITADELRSRGGLKWGDIGSDQLAAWVAEMDFGLSEPVQDALRECAERPVTGYPYGAAENEMTGATIDFQWREFSWKLEPSSIRPVPDVTEGIRRAIMELTPPGSPVVLHTPVYHPFFIMVDRAMRDQIHVPSLISDRGRWTLDLDALEEAFSGVATCFVLCNPWNPIGRVFTQEELMAVADLAQRLDVRVIADEIHAPLVYPGGVHIPFASLDHPAAERAVTVTASSKMWNTPGLKCAQVILTDPDDQEAWDTAFPSEVVGVATPGLLAATAAYGDRSGWRDDVLAYLDRNRGILGEMVVDLVDVAHTPPEGTYLGWLDFRALGLDRPAEFLEKNGGVVLLEGEIFGAPGHARINFATPAPILVEMMERMASALVALDG